VVGQQGLANIGGLDPVRDYPKLPFEMSDAEFAALPDSEKERLNQLEEDFFREEEAELDEAVFGDDRWTMEDF
jgi:hypothetical protein